MAFGMYRGDDEIITLAILVHGVEMMIHRIVPLIFESGK